LISLVLPNMLCVLESFHTYILRHSCSKRVELPHIEVPTVPMIFLLFISKVNNWATPSSINWSTYPIAWLSLIGIIDVSEMFWEKLEFLWNSWFPSVNVSQFWKFQCHVSQQYHQDTIYLQSLFSKKVFGLENFKFFFWRRDKAYDFLFKVLDNFFK
jgi:hypothetical protein